MKNPLAVIIMAAGKGTRMNTPEKAKVMFEVLGIPMIGRVVEMALKLNPKKIVVVVGYQKEMVVEYLNKYNGKIKTVVQEPQLGTGQAVKLAENELRDFEGNVLVLSGDVPLLSWHTLNHLIEFHEQENSLATILTTILNEPLGYGRIVRGEDGSVKEIVEEKDASDEIKKIKEINSGIYIFNSEILFNALEKVTPHNAQNEYYLTDVISVLKKEEHRVSAKPTSDNYEVLGINTVSQLIEVEKILIERIEKTS